jgi:hypothetical protein
MFRDRPPGSSSNAKASSWSLNTGYYLSLRVGIVRVRDVDV